MGAIKGYRSGDLSTQPPVGHRKVIPPWSKVDPPKSMKIEDNIDIKRELSHEIGINNTNVQEQVNSSRINCLNPPRRLSKEKQIALLKAEIETLCKQLASCHSSALAEIASEIKVKNDTITRLKLVEKESPIIPAGIPFVFQWKGFIVDPKEKVFNTMGECFDRFEDILRDHSLIIDEHWRRLFPMCLEGDLEAFYKKTMNVESRPSLTYDEVSNTIQEEFVLFSIKKRSIALKKLTTLKMHPDEHFESFIMRFKRYVKFSKVQDGFITTFYFLQAMQTPLRLYRLIILALEYEQIDRRTDIDHVINVAREYYTLELELQREESKEAANKKSFHCIYHPLYNISHDTKDCRVHKANILQKQKAAKRS